MNHSHHIGEDSPRKEVPLLEIPLGITTDKSSGESHLAVLKITAEMSTVNDSISTARKNVQTTVGYSSAYAKGWEEIFGKEPSAN